MVEEAVLIILREWKRRKRECEVCGELLTLDEHAAGVCSSCQLEAERVG